MARAVLLALACAGTLAAGARYADYSGAIMPHYGGDYGARAAPPADDYRDHSPDASAHLDYKYEEVSSGKIDKPIPTDAEEDNSWNKPVEKSRHENSIDGVEPGALNMYKLNKIDKPTSNDAEGDDSWNKPVKKLRNEKSTDDVEPDALDKYKLDEGPKFQSKYRSNIMVRHRNKNIFRTEDTWNRRVGPGRHDQQIQRADEAENQLHLQGVHDDDSLENEHEKSTYTRREMKPKVRRKVRDRPNLNKHLKVEKDDEVSLTDIRDDQKTLRSGQDYREEEESRLGSRVGTAGGEVGAAGRVVGAAAAEGDDDFAAPSPPARTRTPAKNFNEYDYYDMQRLQSVKKKVSDRLANAWRMTPPAPRPIIATRRTNVQTTRIRSPLTGASLASDTGPTSDPFDSAPLQPATENIRDALTSGPLSPTRTHSTTKEFATISTRHELSIAEKSRLSILKKAQKKESSRFNITSTYKPPVLLQVTNRLQTMVMVERPLEQDPWKLAREVSDDTPERLQNVKRLMRRKLVANADNIRNLTDNWDDVVCDYVDVAMLDAKASSLKAYIPLLILPVVYFIY